MKDSDLKYSEQLIFENDASSLGTKSSSSFHKSRFSKYNIGTFDDIISDTSAFLNEVKFNFYIHFFFLIFIM